MENDEIVLDNERIGRCIRVRMARDNMKNAELARKMGVTQSMIRVYKEGRIYDVRTLYRMAVIFGTTLDGLLKIGSE